MISFKQLIGYDLHISKVAFESDGIEIVLIHDFCLLKRRIYINGEQVFSRHSQCLGFFTDADFSYDGHHYRVITRTVNIVSFRQDVTVWVDGHEVGRKTDPFYAALTLTQKLHAVFGMASFGFVVGLIATMLKG